MDTKTEKKYRGAYCKKCDDVYDEKFDRCPRHGTKTLSVPPDFYERHPECLEVTRLLYNDESSTTSENATVNLDEAIQIVIKEYKRAISKFAPMHSAHEGYAVLKEEVDELWDAIKLNDADNAKEEVIQVAAMAIRFLMDVSYRSAQ